MKKIIILLVLVVLLSGCEIIKPSVNVYFCGGQSNATKIWSDSIAEKIHEVDPTAIIIHNNHSGQSILKWSKDGVRKTEYNRDLKAINRIIKDYNYDFKGFIWFQGEQDFFLETRYDEYYENEFYSLISFFEDDLNDYDFDVFTTLIHTNWNECLLFRDIQQNIIDNNTNIYGIDSKPYHRWDGLHLSNSEYIRLGHNTGNLIIDTVY